MSILALFFYRLLSISHNNDGKQRYPEVQALTWYRFLIGYCIILQGWMSIRPFFIRNKYLWNAPVSGWQYEYSILFEDIVAGSKIIF